MKSLIRFLLPLLVLGSFTFVRSQKPVIQKNGREYEQQQRLKKLLSRVGVDVPAIEARGAQPPQKHRELKIRLSDPTKPLNELRPALSKQEQTPSAAIVEDKKQSGALPRQRSLELSPTQIFIAGVDATNKLRWWSIVPDPRVVRSETPSPTGELRSEDYYVSNVTLVVALPDDPEIANLRFYQPVWNGTDYELKPLTNVPMH